jgi:shikimate 5-dehydrogenase
MKPRILAGLIGAGIQASRTPALHEQEGDAQGLRYLYRLIDLDPLQLDSSAPARSAQGRRTDELHRIEHHLPMQASDPAVAR